MVADGIEGNIYESTLEANSRLLLWNSKVVIVDKIDNPTPANKPRFTFDHSRTTEVLPGCNIELSSRIYDYLLNPRYLNLISTNLKYVYTTVPLYPEDRYIFTFFISGIG